MKTQKGIPENRKTLPIMLKLRLVGPVFMRLTNGRSMINDRLTRVSCKNVNTQCKTTLISLKKTREKDMRFRRQKREQGFLCPMR